MLQLSFVLPDAPLKHSDYCCSASQLLVASHLMKTCRSQDDDFSRCHGKPLRSHARAFSAGVHLRGGANGADRGCAGLTTRPGNPRMQ